VTAKTKEKHPEINNPSLCGGHEFLRHSHRSVMSWYSKSNLSLLFGAIAADYSFMVAGLAGE
jgi:hypothetical protein